MVKKNPDFFLSSRDSIGLQGVFKCYLINKVTFIETYEFMLIRIFPPLEGRKFNVEGRKSLVVIGPRFDEEMLFPTIHFPAFVSVYFLNASKNKQNLEANDLTKIAWGEIYKSENDAKIKNWISS